MPLEIRQIDAKILEYGQGLGQRPVVADEILARPGDAHPLGVVEPDHLDPIPLRGYPRHTTMIIKSVFPRGTPTTMEITQTAYTDDIQGVAKTRSHAYDQVKHLYVPGSNPAVPTRSEGVSGDHQEPLPGLREPGGEPHGYADLDLGLKTLFIVSAPLVSGELQDAIFRLLEGHPNAQAKRETHTSWPALLRECWPKPLRGRHRLRFSEFTAPEAPNAAFLKSAQGAGPWVSPSGPRRA